MSDIQSLATIDHEGHCLELLCLPSDNGGLAFHDLRWAKDQEIVCTITNVDFQRGAPNRRWVSGLVAFDPIAGTAVIQIGELPSDRHIVDYSLREWSLLENLEVRFVEHCDDVLDEFGSNAL